MQLSKSMYPMQYHSYKLLQKKREGIDPLANPVYVIPIVVCLFSRVHHARDFSFDIGEFSTVQRPVPKRAQDSSISHTLYGIYIYTLSLALYCFPYSFSQADELLLTRSRNTYNIFQQQLYSGRIQLAIKGISSTQAQLVLLE